MALLALGTGLPQNLLNSLAQTPDGYPWPESERGLIRFNGIRGHRRGFHADEPAEVRFGIRLTLARARRQSGSLPDSLQEATRWRRTGLPHPGARRSRKRNSEI